MKTISTFFHLFPIKCRSGSDISTARSHNNAFDLTHMSKALVFIAIVSLNWLPLLAQRTGNTASTLATGDEAGLWLPTYAQLISDEINGAGIREIKLIPEPCMSLNDCRLRIAFENPFPGGISILVRTSAGTFTRTTSANTPQPLASQIEFELDGSNSEISEVVSIYINPNGTGYNNVNRLLLADGGTEVIAVVLDQSAYYFNQTYKAEMAISHFKTEQKEAMRIYPNPTSGIFNVYFYGYRSLALSVKDLNGRTVSRLVIYPWNATQLDFSNFPRGVYILSEEPLNPTEGGLSQLPPIKLVLD